MTFLQTITTRKPLKIKGLSPGNGGGYPGDIATLDLFWAEGPDAHTCGTGFTSPRFHRVLPDDQAHQVLRARPACHRASSGCDDCRAPLSEACSIGLG